MKIGGVFMNLAMENLERCFETAKERHIPFIGVKVKMEGFYLC